jgi:phytoene dehydrogenase-like protein
MLLLPTLFYGSPREDDFDWASFCLLFRSIILEGLSRPQGGIKPLLDLLLARLREVGGELRTRAGVRSVRVEGGRTRGVVLDDGSEIETDLVLSSAGWPETMRMTGAEVPLCEVGRLSFLESISVLDILPADLGIGAATSFYCTEPRSIYREPQGLTEPRAGVISAPNNFAASPPMPEGIVRLTVAASHPLWIDLEGDDYAAAKERAVGEAIDTVTRFLPDWRPHTVFRDVFTPRTIERFTWRRNGAIYGSPVKHPDGNTGIDGLALIGTDQGMLGVVGALLSGITIANRHGVPEVRLA